MDGLRSCLAAHPYHYQEFDAKNKTKHVIDETKK